MYFIDMKRPAALPSPRAPKHQRVRETLRQQIMEGHYPPGSALPPETELPKRLRVSKITVVRALNELVREGLVVRRRGRGSFVADPMQRPLIPGRFLKLGVLTPHSVFSDFRYGPGQRDMFRAALATWGAEHVQPDFPNVRSDEATRGRWTCEPRGCQVDLIGEEHASRFKHPPLQTVKEAGLDGILTLSIVQEDWMAELLALGIPTVIVDFPAERFMLQADQVYFDPLPGYRAAVNQFVTAGLKRIHFVGGLAHKPFARFADMPRGEAWYREENAIYDPDTFLRVAAWRQAMSQHSLPAPESWIHHSWASGALTKVLAERLAQLPEEERPQGVVCHSVSQADAFIEVFQKLGLPMIGAGAASDPHSGKALAVYASNQDLGRTAAALLLWKLQHTVRPPLRVGVPMVLQTQEIRS